MIGQPDAVPGHDLVESRARGEMSSDPGAKRHGWAVTERAASTVFVLAELVDEGRAGELEMRLRAGVHPIPGVADLGGQPRRDEREQHQHDDQRGLHPGTPVQADHRATSFLGRRPGASRPER